MEKNYIGEIITCLFYILYRSGLLWLSKLPWVKFDLICNMNFMSRVLNVVVYDQD